MVSNSIEALKHAGECRSDSGSTQMLPRQDYEKLSKQGEYVRFVIYVLGCMDAVSKDYSVEMMREDVKKDMLKLRKHVGEEDKWIHPPFYNKLLNIIWG